MKHRASSLACSLVALALGLAGLPAVAQEPVRPAAPSSADLLRAAYSLRRQGRLEAAAAAFERALEATPPGPEKQALAVEVAELYRVMGRDDRALALFRRNHDVARELEVLFRLGRVNEALTVARLVGNSEGEAEALSRLGQAAEAVAVLTRSGKHRTRGHLLARQGKLREAAEAYRLADDTYALAVALDHAGDAARARAAYQDAAEVLKFRLRNECLRDVRVIQEAFDRAPDGVGRERARAHLARAFAAAALDYERLAHCYGRAGEDPARTAQLAQNARAFVEKQRDTLLDGGGDAYGQQAVAGLKLADRVTALANLARDLQAGRTSPPPGPWELPR